MAAKTKKRAKARKAVLADIIPENKGGRPKSSLDILPEGWRDAVLGIYAGGGADVEVRVWIRQQGCTISNDLWYRWLDEEPEFSETIKEGRDLSEAWWHAAGRGLTVGAMRGNAAVWIMNMKNRFGFLDTVQHGGSIGVHPLDAIANEVSRRPVFDSTRRVGQTIEGSVLETE